MSHVYSYEQIQAIPPEIAIDQLAFERGIHIAQDGLKSLSGEDLIRGAFIYGSSVFEDTNSGSDIDCLVAVPAFNEEVATALREVVSEVKSTSGTSLSLTAYTVEQLVAGYHREREGKVAWLQDRVADRPDLVIGDNPVDLIAPLDKEFITDVDNYLTDQVVSIAWPYIHGFDRNIESTLENVLSTPQKVGRKTLDCLMHKGYLPRETMPDMRKDTIAEAVASVFGQVDPQVVEIQDGIRTDLNLYLDLVEEVRRGLIDVDEYEQLLRATLSVDAPKAIELIERIQRQFRSITLPE